MEQDELLHQKDLETKLADLGFEYATMQIAFDREIEENKYLKKEVEKLHLKIEAEKFLFSIQQVTLDERNNKISELEEIVRQDVIKMDDLCEQRKQRDDKISVLEGHIATLKYEVLSKLHKIKELESLQPKSEWITIEEGCKMPEDNTEVLVYDKWKDIYMADYIKNEFYTGAVSDWQLLKNITHWTFQPLPPTT